MEEITYFEGFAGYGGGSFAIEELEIPNITFKCVGYSEINKYAIQCYEQNHPGIKNYGDISLIDPEDIEDFDVFFGGFPCQDVSLAGKRDLTKGRSMLVNHVFRIIKVKKPKYLVLENVKGLLSMTKFWDSIRWTLQNLGYGVAYKVLNSKDFGIPQNRERVWIVCKLGGWDFMEFQFPQKTKLQLFVKDILEKDIDKKYYLSEKRVKLMLHGERFGSTQQITPLNGVSQCLSASMGMGGGYEPKIRVHSLFPRSSKTNKGGTGPLSKVDGSTYSLDTGNNQCVEIYDDYNGSFRKDKLVGTITQNIGSKSIRNGQKLKISPCLTTELAHSTGKDWDIKRFKEVTGEFRRLTPKECFRLIGFTKDEINLKGLSDTQCYRLAGNGWDINVVKKILNNLFKS